MVPAAGLDCRCRSDVPPVLRVRIVGFGDASIPGRVTLSKRYPAEFRHRVLELLGDGRTVTEVVHDLEIGASTIRPLRPTHAIRPSSRLRGREPLARTTSPMSNPLDEEVGVEDAPPVVLGGFALLAKRRPPAGGRGAGPERSGRAGWGGCAGRRIRQRHRGSDRPTNLPIPQDGSSRDHRVGPASTTLGRVCGEATRSHRAMKRLSYPGHG